MRIRYLLLDFDGPVCDFFAGFPAPDVAARLRERLSDYTPSGWMESTSDPHEILRASSALGREVAASANSELSAFEMEAVQSAVPTPYASKVIKNALANDVVLAIVSNNAKNAVDDYLATHGLVSEISYVSARVSSDPALMKPNPFLVTRALEALHADLKRAALVGDQVSDITAAHHAGIRAIGYANKPGKRERFEREAAEIVIDSMSKLETAVLCSPNS